jgi:hypothetical protein
VDLHSWPNRVFGIDRYPDYQGLIPYGATGPLDAAFLKDALCRRGTEGRYYVTQFGKQVIATG